MKYDKDTMNSLQEAYKSISEGDDHDGMTYKNKQKLKRQQELLKKQQEAEEASNNIVKKESYEKRIEEAIKMSRKEYNKTHKDFKSDDPKNPRVTRYEPGKGTVSTPVKLTDEVDKKKEMDDKMKEVEDMRSLPTRMNLIKTKLRAMGLNMSHVLKGKELSELINYAVDYYISEEGYDIARDQGKVRPSKDKKDATTMPPSKEMKKTQKVNKDHSALELVKKKYKGQIMDTK